MDYIKFTPDAVSDFARASHLTQKQRPWAFSRIVHSMTKSQVQSKLWLGEELIKIQFGFNNVAVIGGWFCHILGLILFDELKCNFVCNYDTDKDSQLISYKFNTRYKDAGSYSASTKNLFYINNLDPRQTELGKIDLVVNCSCEHMFYMHKLKEKHFSDSIQGNHRVDREGK